MIAIHGTGLEIDGFAGTGHAQQHLVAIGAQLGVLHAAGRLRALSPRSTLERGYAIVRTEREIVRTVEQVEKGAELEVEVADGRFGARAQ